jgi:hypothetical protein
MFKNPRKKLVMNKEKLQFDEGFDDRINRCLMVLHCCTNLVNLDKKNDITFCYCSSGQRERVFNILGLSHLLNSVHKEYSKTSDAHPYWR